MVDPDVLQSLSTSGPKLTPSRQDAYTTLVGEAVVAKVRLHVPVDYFRVDDHSGAISATHLK
jgi:hypothetical protein